MCHECLAAQSLWNAVTGIKCKYSLSDRIAILFYFVVICFSCVFLWCLMDDAVGWNPLLVFPERRNVVHGAEVSAQVFLPCGSSEHCHISPQLSAVPSCFLIWCASSLSMLEIPAGIESSPQQLHADYFHAHSEIPPRCSTALCFTKSDRGLLPFYNPVFISINTHHSLHLISVLAYIWCK